MFERSLDFPRMLPNLRSRRPLTHAQFKRPKISKEWIFSIPQNHVNFSMAMLCFAYLWGNSVFVSGDGTAHVKWLWPREPEVWGVDESDLRLVPPARSPHTRQQVWDPREHVPAKLFLRILHFDTRDHVKTVEGGKITYLIILVIEAILYCRAFFMVKSTRRYQIQYDVVATISLLCQTTITVS